MIHQNFRRMIDGNIVDIVSSPKFADVAPLTGRIAGHKAKFAAETGGNDVTR
jgi:hypothetical protein